MLEVENLSVHFRRGTAVNKISFKIEEGETVALVGESGSGKSATALALLGLLRSEGQINFQGRNLSNYSEREMRQVRGAEIGMVFQDPLSALNPTMRIAKQIAEPLRLHKGLNKEEAIEEATNLLESVDVPHPRRYPHQLSGGQRQRAMIAMAIACKPKLLIADEPTTALDVTLQAQILQLLQEQKMGMLLITHDLSVVADVADRVMVMYGGQIMEEGQTEAILQRPRHPYTKALLSAMPTIDGDGEPIPIPGTPPSLSQPKKGCPFADRCLHTVDLCNQESVCPKMTANA